VPPLASRHTHVTVAIVAGGATLQDSDRAALDAAAHDGAHQRRSTTRPQDAALVADKARTNL